VSKIFKSITEERKDLGQKKPKFLERGMVFHICNPSPRTISDGEGAQYLVKHKKSEVSAQRKAQSLKNPCYSKKNRRYFKGL